MAWASSTSRSPSSSSGRARVGESRRSRRRDRALAPDGAPARGRARSRTGSSDATSAAGSASGCGCSRGARAPATAVELVDAAATDPRRVARRDGRDRAALRPRRRPAGVRRRIGAAEPGCATRCRSVRRFRSIAGSGARCCSRGPTTPIASASRRLGWRAVRRRGWAASGGGAGARRRQRERTGARSVRRGRGRDHCQRADRPARPAARAAPRRTRDGGGQGARTARLDRLKPGLTEPRIGVPAWVHPRNKRETFRPYRHCRWTSCWCAGPKRTSILASFVPPGRPGCCSWGPTSRPPTRWIRSRTGSGCRPRTATCGPGSRRSRRGVERRPGRPRSTTTACCASGDGWVSLSPVERALAARAGRAVRCGRRSRVAGSPGVAGGAPTRNALDVHVLRLRRRIAPLGLEVRTVRSRGYLLQSRDEHHAH